MSHVFLCDECGESHDHACMKASIEKLREAESAVTELQKVAEAGKAYISQLEDALASTFTKVVDIFETLEKEVGETLPEKHSFFKECIATLKKVVSDHEEEKGKKNATAN